jgi:hypothetical protein
MQFPSLPIRLECIGWELGRPGKQLVESGFAEDDGVRQDFIDGNPAPLPVPQPPSLSLGETNSAVVEPAEMDFIATTPLVLSSRLF